MYNIESILIGESVETAETIFVPTSVLGLGSGMEEIVFSNHSERRTRLLGAILIT